MGGERGITQKSQDFVALMLWQEGGIEAILASQFQHPHSEDRDPSPIHRADFMYKGPINCKMLTSKFVNYHIVPSHLQSK